MDIRSVSQEEKDKFIAKVLEVFGQIRNVLDTLETDIQTDNLSVQASAVWISRNLANWFDDFMEQIRNIGSQKDTIQQQMQEVSESSNEA